MLRKFWAISTTLSVLLSIPFVAVQPVSASGPGIASTFTDNYKKINVEVKAIYSNGITPSENDDYCITVQRQLNVNEDPERPDIRHIEVNAKTGIRGCMDSGWFEVIGITYYGNNDLLKTTPVATKSVIRVYNDEPVTIPLAIGEQAVKKLKQDWKDVYYQKNGESEYKPGDTILALQEPEERTVFSDLNQFGNNEDAKQRYLDYLEEEGLVNEKYVYTDKAFSLFEDNADGLEVSSPDTLNKEGSVSDSNINTEEVQKDELPPEQTGGEEYQEGSADEVKAIYFDNKEEKTEEDSLPPFGVMLVKYVPYVLAVIVILVCLWWNKRKQ